MAQSKLSAHADKTGGPAILGRPMLPWQSDVMLAVNISQHLHNGEAFALASLASETLVTNVADVSRAQL